MSTDAITAPVPDPAAEAALNSYQRAVLASCRALLARGVTPTRRELLSCGYKDSDRLDSTLARLRAAGRLPPPPAASPPPVASGPDDGPEAGLSRLQRRVLAACRHFIAAGEPVTRDKLIALGGLGGKTRVGPALARLRALGLVPSPRMGRECGARGADGLTGLERRCLGAAATLRGEGKPVTVNALRGIVRASAGCIRAAALVLAAKGLLADLVTGVNGSHRYPVPAPAATGGPGDLNLTDREQLVLDACRVLSARGDRVNRHRLHAELGGCGDWIGRALDRLRALGLVPGRRYPPRDEDAATADAALGPCQLAIRDFRRAWRSIRRKLLPLKESCDVKSVDAPPPGPS